ncbi:MAG: PDZ domain-containing protein [Planctomycetota bacterium]
MCNWVPIGIVLAAIMVPGALAQEQSAEAKTATAIRFEIEGQTIELLLEGETVRVRQGDRLLSADALTLDGSTIRVRGEADVELAVIDLQPDIERFEEPKSAQKKTVQRIGVVVQPADVTLTSQLDLTTALVVLDVEENMPAAKAGLQTHDVIAFIESDIPATQVALESALQSRESNEPLRLKVRRRGQEMALLIEPMRVAWDTLLVQHPAIQTGANRALLTNAVANQLLTRSLEMRISPQIVTSQDATGRYIANLTLEPMLNVVRRDFTRAATAEDSDEKLSEQLRRVEGRLEKIEALMKKLLEQERR